MLIEPPIDRARLLAAIHDDYGITAARLEFIPIGYVAACYAVCRCGRPKYFLKLWPDTPLGRASSAELRQTLPLLRSLSARLTTARVPEPLMTLTGELQATFDSQPYVMFPFFSGVIPAEANGKPSPHWDDVARVFAELHAATAELAGIGSGVRPDDYDIPFEDDLFVALATLDEAGPAETDSRQALSRHVLPRRDDILAELDRLHRLQRSAARGEPAQMVLCHTDLGRDNVLIDSEGLVVLDWDEAALAPAEHDLKIAFFETDSKRFLRTYLAAGGVADLRPERFAFYLLRRHLDDMTTGLLRLLHEDLAPAEAHDAADAIIRWGFDRCAQLDRSVATFDEVVAQSA